MDGFWGKTKRVDWYSQKSLGFCWYIYILWKTQVHSLISKERAWLHVYSPYRVARVVGEVDLGKSHVNDQYFHAHNAALIAVLVLGNNGHLGFSCTLVRGEDKILFLWEKEVLPAPLISVLQTQHNFSIFLFTISYLQQPQRAEMQNLNATWQTQIWNLILIEETVSFWTHERWQEEEAIKTPLWPASLFF